MFTFFAGVNKLMRKIAKTLTTTTQLVRKSDDRYLLQTKNCLRFMTLEFSPGVEFEEKTSDGRKTRSTVTIDDNKLIHTQHGDKPMTIERRFFNDEMIAITTFGNITSTSWSKIAQ